ncbi:hypothetical protein MSIMFI_00739 [Mycobacterium simulans]|uniref:hypothetical protein n=1 Tax=Mycobacterium simulans TaxID=627089 RepID=UPI00174DB15A|nr:hypothetical protein [Mycobacterium simulans]SON59257.1 hypothetical protein MSIMFI_00739 [Mycobacterium simulans]
MNSKNLDVVPAALRAASGVVAGHAQLASSAGSGETSTETAGVAAAGFGSAFGGYCDQFSYRLSVASAALVGAAGAFTAMEDANRAALASIASKA